MKLDCECLVVGGGLAGSMAALRLAQAGRDVLLVERERGAHAKVCGEFLSAEAVEYLHGAGVDPVQLGAVRIEKLRVAAGRMMVETPLPFSALGLSRKVLDEALLARAEEEGGRVMRGVGVESLSRVGAGWNAQLSSGPVIDARQVFLATGKHDLRGWPRPVGRQADMVGLKMHLCLTAEQVGGLRGAIEVFLFRGGYGGLTLVEDGLGNLCLAVRRSVLRERGGWDGLLDAMAAENGHVATRLGGCRQCWPRPLAVAPIPYGYLARAAGQAWLVGDQAAVIPSFTGDGMSIALHTGMLAAATYLKGGEPGDYLRSLSGQLQRGMRIATMFSRAMVHEQAGRLAPVLLGAAPPLLRWLAAATRIPRRALVTNWSSGQAIETGQ